MFPDLRWWHLLLALLLTPVLIVGWFWLAQPTFRFRLAMEIEVDGKVHTGSSIIQVSYLAGGPYERRWHTHVRGVAPIVDLGRHGTVVVLFNYRDTPYSKRLTAVGRPITPTGSGLPRLIGDLPIAVYSKLPEALTYSLPKNEIRVADFPALAWLPAGGDWKTAISILPEEMPTEIHDSARVIRMTIEPAYWSWVATEMSPAPEWLVTMRQDHKTPRAALSDQFSFHPLMIESGYRR